MAHPTFKIQVTWDNYFTERQIKTIVKNVLMAYPNADFFTISSFFDDKNQEFYKLSLMHHDMIAIDNLYQQANYEIRKLA